MTNHVHFVVVPSREDSLAVLFGRANGRDSQARFHSCPMSESHLAAALRYVETNPCRAGMAGSPDQYRWSSAAAYLGCHTDKGGIIDLRFWERAGGAPFWKELLGESSSEAEIVELRKCTYAGRPFGDEAFVEQIEAGFQRRWLRKSQKSASAA
jgi:putative transposase